MKREYDLIDIAKLLASIMIFAMHCNMLDQYSIIIEFCARWGVPFFFLCSGFFLFSKESRGNISKDILINYTHRLVMLYMLWLVFNLPNVFYQRLYSKDLSTIDTWLIFLKNSILSSTFTGSWYLISSICSAWVVYLLSIRYQTNTTIMFTLFFYIICTLTSVYNGILPQPISRVLRFLCFPFNAFSGCLYFAIAKYTYEHMNKITEIFTIRRLILLFIFFYIIYGIELYISNYFKIMDTTDAAFSTICFAYPLFLLCLKSNIHIKRGIIFRKLSIIIFCCQGNILLLNGFLKRKGFSSFISFFICAIIIAIICLFVFYLQNKKRYKWSKYLT